MEDWITHTFPADLRIEIETDPITVGESKDDSYKYSADEDTYNIYKNEIITDHNNPDYERMPLS